MCIGVNTRVTLTAQCLGCWQVRSRRRGSRANQPPIGCYVISLLEIGSGLRILKNFLRFWYSTLLLLEIKIHEISDARRCSLKILHQLLLWIISAFATRSRMQSVYNFRSGANPAISFINELNWFFYCIILELNLLLVGERRVGLTIYLQLGWGLHIGV